MAVPDRWARRPGTSGNVGREGREGGGRGGGGPLGAILSSPPLCALRLAAGGRPRWVRAAGAVARVGGEGTRTAGHRAGARSRWGSSRFAAGIHVPLSNGTLAAVQPSPRPPPPLLLGPLLRFVWTTPHADARFLVDEGSLWGQGGSTRSCRLGGSPPTPTAGDGGGATRQRKPVWGGGRRVVALVRGRLTVPTARQRLEGGLCH